MDRKQELETIISQSFISDFNTATGRQLSLTSCGDKPDVICNDKYSGETVGIEITELLSSEGGKERSLNEKTYTAVKSVLEKHAKGGIVSIGHRTAFPTTKVGLSELKQVLAIEIDNAGGLQRFAQNINLRVWKHKGFILSDIYIDDKKKEWTAVTDYALPYQSQTATNEDVINTVTNKARLSRNYSETDELILLIRNPHSAWQPSPEIKQQIASAKGKYIHSVWMINWKMDTLPVDPHSIRIDQ